ncbi:MAG: sulfatase-like hydrolase/transferase, partial [Bacteroides sp.]|uniref:sulfatase-like hydrolase/transferase n=1 Tax=Bacteroides sp. TaxID=29523 RepID=UPI002FCB2A3C
MNHSLYASLLLAPLAATPLQAQCANPAERTDKRPNIILFMVDDMGWEDTSLPFWSEKTHYNKMYETPNMERLAAQGMMFTQAYASSISSPTRCSLITGTNAARHRVTNWTLQKNTATDRKSDVLQLPDWNYNGVSQVTGTPNTFVGTSFVQLLKNSGYHTIHCGKAHFGAIDTPGEDPHHWGFEVNIAGHAAGGLASYLGEENYGYTKDGKPRSLMSVPGLEKYWGTETFVTEALTEETLAALDKAKKYNQPFYLYMAHYAIHVPIDKDMRFYQKYIDKGMTPKEAAYATLIEGMDKSLGDIMNWLDANGEADNTVFLFMSDNGGLSSEPEWRDGRLHTQNFPLNSGKGSAYEGGIREPMIVRWPGVVEPGTKCDRYVIIEDFY